MRIILSGGGAGEQTKELDNLFANILDKNKPLLYIPIAIDSIKHPYNDCLSWLKSTFDKLGISKYQMWTEEDLKKSRDISPLEFSGIYIGGGNTPYLLKQLKETGAWNFLIKAIKKNIPIYGGSAGAIIFSKSIKPSLNFDKNWSKLKKFEGMNLIKENYLFCHFTVQKDEQIKKIIINEKISSSIALTERSGLFINEDKIKVIGQESSWIFDNKGNKKELSVGSYV
jgi:dipeptidase E